MWLSLVLTRHSFPYMGGRNPCCRCHCCCCCSKAKQISPPTHQPTNPLTSNQQQMSVMCNWCRCKFYGLFQVTASNLQSTHRYKYLRNAANTFSMLSCLAVCLLFYSLEMNFHSVACCLEVLKEPKQLDPLQASASALASLAGVGVGWPAMTLLLTSLVDPGWLVGWLVCWLAGNRLP